MKSMIVSYLPISLIVLPILMTLLFYFFGVHFTGNRWKSIHKASQWTAIFYVIAVSLLLEKIFQHGFIGYILILLIIILAVILIIQWKKDTEVTLLSGLRLLWRISFLLFSLTYVGLVIYMIVRFIQLQNGI